MRSVIGESAVLLWFGLVMGTFFVPSLPPAIGTALYGLFLVIGIAALALRFLRSREENVENVVPVAVASSVVQKKGKRRG